MPRFNITVDTRKQFNDFEFHCLTSRFNQIDMAIAFLLNLQDTTMYLPSKISSEARQNYWVMRKEIMILLLPDHRDVVKNFMNAEMKVNS